MITTKKLGPTNTKGARIVATGGGHRVTIPYPYEFRAFEAHLSAAKVLAERFGWTKLAYSDSPDRTGYVFLNAKFSVDLTQESTEG